MREFIENEYELYCKGKLLFELIWVESFDYLRNNNILKYSIDDLRTAFGMATDYRRQVLRKFLNQDNARSTSFLPVTLKEQRKTEFRIRVWVAKQMMVKDFYEKCMKEGRQRIFLELPQTVISLQST